MGREGGQKNVGGGRREGMREGKGREDAQTARYVGLVDQL